MTTIVYQKGILKTDTRVTKLFDANPFEILKNFAETCEDEEILKGINRYINSPMLNAEGYVNVSKGKFVDYTNENIIFNNRRIKALAIAGNIAVMVELDHLIRTNGYNRVKDELQVINEAMLTQAIFIYDDFIEVFSPDIEKQDIVVYGYDLNDVDTVMIGSGAVTYHLQGTEYISPDDLPYNKIMDFIYPFRKDINVDDVFVYAFEHDQYTGGDIISLDLNNK